MIIFESYLEIINNVVTGESVEEVAKKLPGSMESLGTYLIAMSCWLLKYSRPSEALRDSFVKLIEWSANGYPTWVDYRALIRCRLIVLIKFQGV